MILSFANPGSEDIYDGNESKAALKLLPRDLWRMAQRKLTVLNAAKSPEDLRSPPGNHLEKLSGDMKGKYSIRINKPFRITFAFENGNATEVQISNHYR